MLVVSVERKTIVKRAKPWQSKKLMNWLFNIKGYSEEEIAEKLKTDQSTINRWLRKHELKRDRA